MITLVGRPPNVGGLIGTGSGIRITGGGAVPVVTSFNRPPGILVAVAGKDGTSISIGGTVPTYAELPTLTVADKGTLYIVEANGLGYTWSGAGWPDVESGIEIRGPEGVRGNGITGSSLMGDVITFTTTDGTETVTVPSLAAAAQSAIDAALSAGAASTSASDADGFAQAALGSAGTASTHATNASNRAGAASDSETAAGVSESNASTSESNASDSETQTGLDKIATGADRTATGLSAVAAATSETNAGLSETAAANSAGAAQTAQTGAETAQGFAEDAQAAAEQAAAEAEQGAPAGGWSEAELAVGVQDALGLARSAIQSVTDVVPATASVRGIIKLGGDLAGTADAPTVPALAGKANTVHTHTIANVTGLQGVLDAKGTSNLTIGTGAGNAKAGNYQPTVANISNAGTVGRNSMLATTQAAGRSAIGAGTGNSDLTIGTTSSTAMAGNYQPTIADVTGLLARLQEEENKRPWIGTELQLPTTGDPGRLYITTD